MVCPEYSLECRSRNTNSRAFCHRSMLCPRTRRQATCSCCRPRSPSTRGNSMPKIAAARPGWLRAAGLHARRRQAAVGRELLVADARRVHAGGFYRARAAGRPGIWIRRPRSSGAGRTTTGPIFSTRARSISAPIDPAGRSGQPGDQHRRSGGGIWNLVDRPSAA